MEALSFAQPKVINKAVSDYAGANLPFQTRLFVPPPPASLQGKPYLAAETPKSGLPSPCAGSCQVSPAAS